MFPYSIYAFIPTFSALIKRNLTYFFERLQEVRTNNEQKYLVRKRFKTGYIYKLMESECEGKIVFFNTIYQL